MSTLTPTRPAVKPGRAIRPAHGTCRLTLDINGAPYRVAPVPCDREAATRRFEPRKHRDPGLEYRASPEDRRLDDRPVRRGPLDREKFRARLREAARPRG